MNRLEPFGDYLRFVIVGSATTQQGTHAHHAEIVLRKANSGQSGMHVGRNHFLVVETDHGNIVRHAFPRFPQRVVQAERGAVVMTEHSGRTRRQHLCCRSVTAFLIGGHGQHQRRVEIDVEPRKRGLVSRKTANPKRVTARHR